MFCGISLSKIENNLEKIFDSIFNDDLLLDYISDDFDLDSYNRNRIIAISNAYQSIIKLKYSLEIKPKKLSLYESFIYIFNNDEFINDILNKCFEIFNIKNFEDCFCRIKELRNCCAHGDSFVLSNYDYLYLRIFEILVYIIQLKYVGIHDDYIYDFCLYNLGLKLNQ